jgi:hypothetical protein
MMATATPRIAITARTRGGQCHDESSFKSRFNQWAQFFLTDIPQGPSAYLNATYINFGRSQHSCITNNCLERAMTVYGVRRDDYDPTSISGSCRNIRRS